MDFAVCFGLALPQSQPKLSCDRSTYEDGDVILFLESGEDCDIEGQFGSVQVMDARADDCKVSL
jgi:hypothetical protein